MEFSQGVAFGYWDCFYVFFSGLVVVYCVFFFLFFAFTVDLKTVNLELVRFGQT